MSLKRKMSFDEELSTLKEFRPMKQVRIQLSLNNQSDDIAMDDASSESSSVSVHSSTADIADYPRFNLYPFPSCDTADMEMDGVTQNYQLTSSSEFRTSSDASNDSSVGLLKPKSSFIHNVANCVQIPRLRVACEAGLGGSRTLWTQCDQCGAIEMIA